MPEKILCFAQKQISVLGGEGVNILNGEFCEEIDWTSIIGLQVVGAQVIELQDFLGLPHRA